MKNIASPEYSRNYGFWNEAEQIALMNAHVAIAGVGGDGHEEGFRQQRRECKSLIVGRAPIFAGSSLRSRQIAGRVGADRRQGAG